MQPAEARAKLGSPAELDTPVSVTIPRAQVEEALRMDDEPPDLVLDVLRRTNGDSERRNVAVEWDRGDLERLLAEADGDSITLTLDANAVNAAFDDVVAHGMREAIVVLAAVVASATTAGAAAAQPAEATGIGLATPAATSVASPDIVAGGYGEPAAYGTPRPTPADYATPAGEVASPDIVAGGYGEPTAYGTPRATPADYATPATPGTFAAPDVVSGGYGEQPTYGTPRPTPADYRVGDEPGGGGITIDVPAAAWAALAGGIALAIAGAAFVARQRRVQPT